MTAERAFVQYLYVVSSIATVYTSGCWRQRPAAIIKRIWQRYSFHSGKDMQIMELRHLRYFLAVAEELNFTRAAERLGISQPPLTQQVKALEAELGVALLDRSAYRIELTDAGRIFAAEAARILGDARSAVQAARRAATGATGRVRVGFTESASFNPLVTSSLRSFRADFPAVEVSLEEHPSTELIVALREERIDAAFVRPPLPAE